MTLHLEVRHTFVQAKLVSDLPAKKARARSCPPSLLDPCSLIRVSPEVVETFEEKSTIASCRSPSLSPKSSVSTEFGGLSLGNESEFSLDSQSMQSDPVNWADEPVGSVVVDSVPSVGSVDHWIGTCKPCAYFYTRGCMAGQSCTFCHLCDAEERKRRRKQKIAAMRAQRDAYRSSGYSQ